MNSCRTDTREESEKTFKKILMGADDLLIWGRKKKQTKAILQCWSNVLSYCSKINDEINSRNEVLRNQHSSTTIRITL
jgi:hypothetical protein